MNGQMSLCQICMFQDRRVDDGQNAGCVAGSFNTDHDTCGAFVILGGPALGARLAELYNLVDLAWDVIMILLEKVEGERVDSITYRLTDKGVDALETAGSEESSAYIARAASGIDALG